MMRSDRYIYIYISTITLPPEISHAKALTSEKHAIAKINDDKDIEIGKLVLLICWSYKARLVTTFTYKIQLQILVIMLI